jgi:riboflavin kinase/FMN adenylyltransferase
VYRVPEVITDPFDKKAASAPWREYADRVLIGRLNAAYIVAGHDYTFGRGGEGTGEKLAEYCASLNIGCEIIPPVCINGARASSSYIRRLIAEGDMELAGRFLGRRYCLPGTVERGKGLGRELGSPTVNFPLPPERQSPKWGVYATVVIWNGRRYPSITNVGVRPSVESGGAPVVETTLFDFGGSLYGEYINVEFARFIRPEIKFSSLSALREQINKDIKTVKELNL